MKQVPGNTWNQLLKLMDPLSSCKSSYSAPVALSSKSALRRFSAAEYLLSLLQNLSEEKWWYKRLKFSASDYSLAGNLGLLIAKKKKKN